MDFEDGSGRSTPLIHSGPLGRNCNFSDTLPRLAYVILHDDSLKARFLSSEYSRGFTSSSSILREWVNEAVDGPINNLLRLALFISDLR